MGDGQGPVRCSFRRTLHAGNGLINVKPARPNTKIPILPGRAGKREYIQILRLTEIAPPNLVGAVITEAIRRGVIGFDAVKQLLVARIEGKPARLDAHAYPYLPKATVKTTVPSDYAALLSRRVA